MQTSSTNQKPKYKKLTLEVKSNPRTRSDTRKASLEVDSARLSQTFYYRYKPESQFITLEKTAKTDLLKEQKSGAIKGNLEQFENYLDIAHEVGAFAQKERQNRKTRANQFFKNRSNSNLSEFSQIDWDYFNKSTSTLPKKVRSYSLSDISKVEQEEEETCLTDKPRVLESTRLEKSDDQVDLDKTIKPDQFQEFSSSTSSNSSLNTSLKENKKLPNSVSIKSPNSSSKSTTDTNTTSLESSNKQSGNQSPKREITTSDPTTSVINKVNYPPQALHLQTVQLNPKTPNPTPPAEPIGKSSSRSGKIELAALRAALSGISKMAIKQEHIELGELKEQVIAELTEWLKISDDDDQLSTKIENSVICQTLLSKYSIDSNDLKATRAEYAQQYFTKTVQYAVPAGIFDDFILSTIVEKDLPTKYNSQEDKSDEESTAITNFESEIKQAAKTFFCKAIKTMTNMNKGLLTAEFTNKSSKDEKVSYLLMAKTILMNMFIVIIMAVDKNSKESERSKCIELLQELNIQRMDQSSIELHSRIDSADLEILGEQVIKIIKMTKTASTANRCMATSTVENSLTKINSSTVAKMLKSEHVGDEETDQRKKAQCKMAIKKFKNLLGNFKTICTKYVSNGNFDREMKLDFETVKCCFDDLMTINKDRATYKDLQADSELGCITKLINAVKETIIEVSKGTSFTLNEQIHKLSIQQTQNAEKAKGLTRKPLPILNNIDISRYAKERYNLPVKKRKGFEAEPYAPPFYLQEQQTWMKFAMTSLEAYNLESGLESYNDWLIGSFRTLKLERHKRIWWSLFIFNEQGQIDYTNLIKTREEYLKALTIIGAKIDPSGIESVDPIGCLYEYNHSPNQQVGELGSDLLERLIESLSKANSTWHKNIADKKMLILMFNKRVTDEKLLTELSSVRYSSFKGTMNSGDYELLRTLLLDYENAEMERSRNSMKDSSTRIIKPDVNMSKVKLFLQSHYCNLRNKDFIIAKALSTTLPANNYDEAIIAYSDEVTKISSEMAKPKPKKGHKGVPVNREINKKAQEMSNSQQTNNNNQHGNGNYNNNNRNNNRKNKNNNNNNQNRNNNNQSRNNNNQSRNNNNQNRNNNNNTQQHNGSSQNGNSNNKPNGNTNNWNHNNNGKPKSNKSQNSNYNNNNAPKNEGLLGNSPQTNNADTHAPKSTSKRTPSGEQSVKTDSKAPANDWVIVSQLNGIPFPSLLDPGSNDSHIRMEVAEQLVKNSNYKIIPHDRGASTCTSDAAGTQGMIKNVEVKIPGAKQSLFCNFYIMPKCVDEVLLGQDVNNELKKLLTGGVFTQKTFPNGDEGLLVSLDGNYTKVYDNKRLAKLSIDNDTWINKINLESSCSFTKSVKTVETDNKIQRKGMQVIGQALKKERMCSVHVKHDVVIEPNSNYAVEVDLYDSKICKKTCSNKKVILSLNWENYIKLNATSPEIFVDCPCQQDEFYINYKITNHSDQQQILKKGSKLGEIHTVNGHKAKLLLKNQKALEEFNQFIVPELNLQKSVKLEAAEESMEFNKVNNPLDKYGLDLESSDEENDSDYDEYENLPKLEFKYKNETVSIGCGFSEPYFEKAKRFLEDEEIGKTFYRNDDEILPPMKNHKMKVQPDEWETLPNVANQKIPESKLEMVKGVIDTLKKRGIVEFSHAAYSCPIMVKPKAKKGKNGKIRLRFILCLQDLSKKCKLKPCDTETPEQICRYFKENSIRYNMYDMKDGYFQIEIEIESRDYFTFKILGIPGRFRLTRAAQGFLHSGADLNEGISKNLKKIKDNGSTIQHYFDDMVDESNSEEECLHQAMLFLRNAKECQITLNPDKTFLGCKSAILAGYKIKGGSIKTPKKFRLAIRRFKENPPRSHSELRSFMGFINFLRNYVEKFSVLTAPLTDLISTDDRKFKWEDEQVKAYYDVLDTLDTELMMNIMVYGDPNRPIDIHCDGSNDGFGISIMQKDKNGILRMCHCWSRKTSAAEKNADSFKLENIAFGSIIKVFGNILNCRKTLKRVHVDCRSLYLMASNQRGNGSYSEFLAECRNYLEPLEIIWLPGKLNIHADVLSRIGNASKYTDPDEINDKRGFMELYNLSPANIYDRLKSQGQEQTDNGRFWFNMMSNEGKRQACRRNKNSLAISNEAKIIANTDEDCWGHQFENSREFIKEKMVEKWPDVSDGLLQAKYCHKNFHAPPRKLAKWFNITTSQAQQIINNCSNCFSNPYGNNHPQNIEMPIKKPAGPWTDIHIDVAEFSHLKNKYFLCVYDIFSGLIIIEHITCQKAGTVANALANVFKFYGPPKTVTTDAHKAYRCDEFYARMCEMHVMVKAVAPTYKNGLGAERAIRSCKNVLNRLAGRPWFSKDNLYKCCVYLNCARVNWLNQSPFETFFNFKPDILQIFGAKIPSLDDERQSAESSLKDCLEKRKQNNEYTNKLADKIQNIMKTKYKENDVVMYNSEKTNKIWREGVIKNIHNDGTVDIVDTITKEMKTRHISQVAE